MLAILLLLLSLPGELPAQISITCPPDTYGLPCASAVPTPDANSVVASSDCGGPVAVAWVSDSIRSEKCANIFHFRRSYQATDLCGNSISCQQTISVLDLNPPSVICPSNVTVPGALYIPAPATNSVTASDTCGGAVMVTWVSDVITVSNSAKQFTITRTYRAADDCGNSALCQQTITVNDTSPPLIPIQETKLRASDAAAEDIFGRSVSVSADGNTVLVGASADDTVAGKDAGSAYVFVRSGNTWSEQAHLMASDGSTNDGFGSAVSLSADGNTALVGALCDDSNRGSAYVFVRSGSAWSQQVKLTADDGAVGDYFGMVASLSGDGKTALVGSIFNTTPVAPHAGSAYVFVRNGNTWSQQAKLTADDGATYEKFGGFVSVSGNGNTAVVGAVQHSTAAGMNVGSAYVFVRSGDAWSQQAELTAADGAAHDEFGFVTVSGDGNTVLVGAHFHATGTMYFAGIVYVFVRSGSTWIEQARLTADDSAAYAQLGALVSLSCDGNTALVGSNAEGRLGTGAYVFVRRGGVWSQQCKLAASDAASRDYISFASLSGDGTTALLGAEYQTTSDGAHAGSAYVFRLIRPGIVIPPQMTNGVFHVRYAGSPTNLHTIESAPNVNGPWTILTNLTSDANGLFDLFDATEAPQRFYRTIAP